MSDENNNDNSSLSIRALLISMPISQWAGRKKDQKATATVMQHHNTGSESGSYTKKLLPDALELAKVAGIASKAAQFFHENTLPWLSDGTRIISGKNYLPFTTEFRKLKSLFEQAVRDLEAAYPRLKANAERKLGDLYNESDYPEHIADKFDIEVNFLPMPDVKDFRIEISEAEKKEFERKMIEVEKTAMRDAWSRLHTVVKNASEKLANPDAIFRDSLLENITEITAMLPMLNISDDKELEKKSKEIDALVASYRTDNLRDNPTDRSNAAKALAEMEKNLSAYTGNKKGNK